MVPFLCGSVESDMSMNLDSSCTSSSISSASSCTTPTSCDNGNGLYKMSVSCVKPHKANDAAWEAIRGVERRDGSVGLKHFKLVRRLGSGDIGNVFLCQLRGSGNCFYAMKVVNREALSYRNKLHRAEMEKEILCMLDHPFLPTLYAHFDASHYSCTVMEYCPGGDLHSLRHRQPGKRFGLRSARFYAAEVLVALEYLHMMGVIFRDLKPENVLVRADGHIMLSDFDLSFKCDVVPTLENPINASEGNNRHCKSSVHRHTSASAASSCCNTSSNSKSTVIKPSASGCIPIVQLRRWLLSKRPRKNILSHKNNTMNTSNNNNNNSSCVLSCKVQPELVAEPSEVRSRSFVGTHEYLAPEVTSGEGHGSAVDWWTFGVFLFELLYGKTPFRGPNNEATILNIISLALKFPQNPTRDTQAWDDAKDLISRLLAKDPRTRLGSNRGSADIKTHPFFKGINWPLIRSAVPPVIPGLRRTQTCYEKERSTQKAPSHFDYF